MAVKSVLICSRCFKKLLHPKKLSFKGEGEITFSHKQELRKFVANRAALQEMFKEVRPGSCERCQVVLNLACVTGGRDIDKFQSPLFEGQFAEELLGPSAVGAGGLDEHNHLPGLDFAVHKLLSHADRQLPPGEESSIAGIARV